MSPMRSLMGRTPSCSPAKRRSENIRWDAVHVLTEIAKHTEDYVVRKGLATVTPKLLQMIHRRTAAIAHGAKAIVEDIDAKLADVWSQAGGSTRYISSAPLRRAGGRAAFDRPGGGAADGPLLRDHFLQAQIPGHFDDLPLLVDEICAEHQLAALPGMSRVVIAAVAAPGHRRRYQFIVGAYRRESLNDGFRDKKSHGLAGTALLLARQACCSAP